LTPYSTALANESTLQRRLGNARVAGGDTTLAQPTLKGRLVGRRIEKALANASTLQRRLGNARLRGGDAALAQPTLKGRLVGRRIGKALANPSSTVKSNIKDLRSGRKKFSGMIPDKD
jgi:hypothetical protein